MSPRLRYLVSSFLIGVMGVGLAWAGSALAPPRLGGSAAETQAPLGGVRAQLAAASVDGGLAAGQLLAGAAKASIEPRPDDWGGTWARSGCATLGEDFAEGAPHALDPRVRWFENSNCIYSGGFGIGPMNGLTQWDEKYGLWVRSLAVSDGDGDTLVMTILDGAYYFGRYNNMCSPSLRPDTPAPGDGCGFFDLSEDLGAELGIPASSFMFASTHSHASPDFIGAWGGVPRWYMNQVTDALKASVRAAVASMEPAYLEAGEEMARQFSNERRDFYRSAEEYGVAWVRLVAQGDPAPTAPLEYSCTIDCPVVEGNSEGSGESTRSGINAVPIQTPPPGCEASGGRPEKCPTPTPTVEPTPTQEPTEEPTPEPTEPTGPTEPTLRAIATVGAFAAHPTNKGSGPIAHADFPGPFEQRVEDLWGGVGLFFQTGLGNVSSSSGGHPEGSEKVEQMGFGLASLMPPLGKGRLMYDPDAPVDLTVAQRFWNQPSTNTVLSAGGGSGVFDRPFEALPSSVSAGEEADVGPTKHCKSASPFSVSTAVSAAKIGDLWITGAPGEIFSNYSNTIKEKNPRSVTLPLALVNDGLGYIMQSFETDHAGRQGLGFAGVVVEYEDAYSIDACFGDAALEATLILLGDAPEGNLVALP